MCRGRMLKCVPLAGGGSLYRMRCGRLRRLRRRHCRRRHFRCRRREALRRRRISVSLSGTFDKVGEGDRRAQRKL